MGMGEHGGQFHGLIIRFRVLQIGCDAVDRGVQFLRFRECFLGHLPWREFQVMVHLLRQIAHGEFLRLADVAFVEVLLPGQDLQQGALSCSVPAYQPNAVVASNEERNTVEHGAFAEMEEEVGDADHFLGPQRYVYQDKLADGQSGQGLCHIHLNLRPGFRCMREGPHSMQKALQMQGLQSRIELLSQKFQRSCSKSKRSALISSPCSNASIPVLYWEMLRS
jgi:hypothetical protein